MENQGDGKRTPFIALGIALGAWFVLSWLVVATVLDARNRAYLDQQAAAVSEQADSIARNIDTGLNYLHGIPALIAQEEKVAAALARFGATGPSLLPIGQRNRMWSADPLLQDVNAYLAATAVSLRADVLIVVNAAGDCIAASNAGQPESFVGTNYADRDYFRQAREGRLGRQYAMGRKTNIPGLFFSAPIMAGNRFVGVAVAKIDLPKLSHWVSQTDAFISDENGVVILAHDPALEMRSLSHATVSLHSKSERLARYKRTEFPPLAIVAWGDSLYPALQRFGDEKQPMLMASRFVIEEGIQVHAFARVPAAAGFGREKLESFLLLAIAGALTLFLIAGRIVFGRVRADSASLLRAAIEATADGILVVDSAMRVVLYNQRFTDIWRIPPEALATGNDDEVLHAATAQVEDAQAFRDKVAELYAHPEISSHDALRFKDGREIERYSFPQRQGDHIVGRVWSFRDVTERELAAKALRKSYDELENKVGERTADLEAANIALIGEKIRQEQLIKQLAETHTQLLQSEKLASIGQLAAGVAHEINNPIGFVNSNLTTLQSYVDKMLALLAAYERHEPSFSEAERREFAQMKAQFDFSYLRNDVAELLKESEDGLQRVKRIVQDLKEFSHVDESGRQMANIEKGLDSTLNVVWNELKYKAEVIKEYGGIPEIECIPSQLNQVFMNLLLNAVQAIEAHGRIVIRTGQENGKVWVEVADSGSGIQPENMSRLFDPFFTTKPVGKGTGLGLALSYGIVEKHGGHIDVTSEVGKGTTFRVVLPIKAAS